MSEVIKKNLSNTNHWMRLLLTVVYALIFWLGTWVLCFVVVLNLLLLLINDQRNSQLSEFGAQVADYLGQIMRFATLNSDDRPFPFGDWPAADDSAGPVPQSAPQADPEPEAASPKPAPKARKTPRKKKAKKKVSKKSSDNS